MADPTIGQGPLGVCVARADVRFERGIELIRAGDIETGIATIEYGRRHLNTEAHTDALWDVLTERGKQRERWGDDHDDAHTNPNGLTLAASALAIFGEPGVPDHLALEGAPAWVRSLCERHGPRERKVIAAALLLAEIERLDRAAAKPSPRRVPGRPAGQRIADDPTPEARELLGMPPREG